ncbi:MAG: ATP synthase F1 subunit epsilon [Candidatus Adiutrix sp.]|jgi:F-type H+-transporting ATPase subunit epsilon|nr:ATP synthase F1 subunit epsilon [Candidatus Adiutrix sp.]
MSDKKIHLRVVTPTQTVLDAPVDMVGAMGSEGAFTALPGHIDFLTDLQPGVLWYRQENQTRELAVSGGFIEVRPYKASVLADSAEYVEDIDVERAERALKKAADLMAKAKVAGQSGQDDGKAEITQITSRMNRAAVRLKLATKKLPR